MRLLFDRIEALGVRCVKNGPKTGKCVKNPYRIKWGYLHQMGISFTRLNYGHFVEKMPIF